MAIKEIKLYYNEMFQAEKKVADYILDHPREVVNMSMAELAKASGTSDATIVRMCRHIGFKGFYQTKISLASALAQETGAELGRNADAPDDAVDFFSHIAQNVSEAGRNINTETLMTCVEIIGKADTVFTAAWGNTGEIAADLAHRLTLKGIKSFVTDTPEYAIRSLNLGTANDVLICISHSGETEHVIMAMELAKELGMMTILITNTPKSPAVSLADHVLCTNVWDDLFLDLGAVSHFMEFVVVDALIYFLKDKNKKGERAEMRLSQYKI